VTKVFKPTTTSLDRYTKKLSTSIFLLLFVEAQLQRRKGLRGIMRELQADEEFQQALGITSISAAQFSRKNNQLDPEVLQSILCDLLTRLHRVQSPSVQATGPVKVIDSTKISLCLIDFFSLGEAEFEADLLLRHRRKCGDEPNLGVPDRLLLVTLDEA